MIRSNLESRPPREVTSLKRLLRRPWCWPADRELRSRAEQLVGGCEPAQPGHTVAVTLGSPSVAWEIGPDLPRNTAYTGSAADVAWQAERIALAALPLTPRIDRLRATVRMGLAPLALAGPAPTAIDGGSHGLALVLAHASYRLDAPIPSDLAALAAVEGRAVRPVGGLREKLDRLWEDAPGIRRLLVHPEQMGEVDDRFEAQEAKSVGDAIGAAFPDVERRLQAHLRAHPEAATLLAEQLRRVVLSSGVGLVSWTMVAETARLILAVAQDPAAREDAELARAIALRHEIAGEGFPHAYLSPRLAAERDPRMQLLAHWVQSFTDGVADTPARTAAETALAEVAPVGQRTRVDAILLGAIGRAFASVGDLERAREVLGEAVALWMASGLEDQANHAVCELLRVVSLLGDEAAFAQACEWAERVSAHLDTTRISKGFLTLALVRAHVLRGELDQAEDRLVALGEPDPATLPEHLVGGLERWRARVLDQRGQTAEADQLRATIADRDSRGMAMLDRARRDGRDPDLAVEELRRVVRGAEIDRLLGRRPEEIGVLDWLADQFRY